MDAHRGDGKRFVVHADEKLSAFVELERAIDDFAVNLSGAENVCAAEKLSPFWNFEAAIRA